MRYSYKLFRNFLIIFLGCDIRDSKLSLEQLQIFSINKIKREDKYRSTSKDLKRPIRVESSEKLFPNDFFPKKETPKKEKSLSNINSVKSCSPVKFNPFSP